MIELKNVCKSYDGGRRFVVRDVSLKVGPGQLLVLLGGSGCGKTTTLKMINRLIDPTSGEIAVDGTDVRKANPVHLRREIGYVFQGIGLFPHLTVGENIATVPRLLGATLWPEKVIADRVDALLNLVKLPPAEFKDRLPARLSGGQQQRVGFARALAAQPKVMLLDEPFGALDPITRDELREEFLEILRDQSLAAVMVTHDMTEALLSADRIAVMNAGRVVQDGTPSELLAKPKDDFVARLLATPKRHADRLEARPPARKGAVVDELFATLPTYLGGHLVLSLTALAAAVAIGVPLGIYASRRPRLNEVLLAGAGIVQTVPSLALLGLLVVVLGGTIGFWPAFIALVLYAILPVLANTVVGIRGVDAAHLEAARGVGMTPWQILRQVELPLAAPVLLGGIRTATVLVVGTATLATPVGGVSLGNYIFAGLGTHNNTATVFGCVAVALLALVLDQLLFLLQIAIDWKLRGWWSRPLAVVALAGLLGLAAWGLREPIAELFPARSRAVLAELFAQLPAYLGGHLVLSVGAVAVAVLVGVPLGVFGYWWPALGQVFRAGAGIVQTVPSLALLGLLVVVLGGMIGFWPAFVALVLYAILPILANTLDGLRGVDPALTEAARGVGMTRWEALSQVELPFAAPVLLGGVRTATVLTVGTATLATAVGGLGLGNYIFAGLATLNHTATVFGCVVAALLAVGLDQLIRRFEVAARERSWAPARWAIAALALVLVVGLFDPAVRWWTGKERVVIASLEFTEQYILSRVIAGEVEDAGFDADRREGMPYGLALMGLRAGSVDCMVAYTGDIVAMLMPTKSATTEEVMDHLDKEYGVPCLGRLGFENNYCVVINPKADKMDQVRTIDDLVKLKREQGLKLKLGADLVFYQRDEWPRFQALHGLTNDDVVKSEMSPTLLYQALASPKSELDAIVAYSSDGRIPAFGLVELKDTKQVFRKYEAILLVSRAAASRPGFLAAVRPLLDKIEQTTMREANKSVDVDQQSPAEAASSLRDEVRKLRLLDHPQDGDEHDRPDDGDDELADEGIGPDAGQTEQPAAEDRPDDADDDVADEAVAAALHDLTGDKAGAQTDQQEVEELHDGTPNREVMSPTVTVVAGRVSAIRNVAMITYTRNVSLSDAGDPSRQHRLDDVPVNVG